MQVERSPYGERVERRWEARRPARHPGLAHVYPQVRSAAAVMTGHGSHRATFLMTFAVLYGLIGFSYLQPIPKPFRPLIRQSLYPLLEWVTLPFLGWCWITAGGLMLVGALFRTMRGVGFGAAMLLPFGWCAVYGYAWLAGHNARGWVNATIYAALMVAVAVVAHWPEPKLLRRVRK